MFGKLVGAGSWRGIAVVGAVVAGWREGGALTLAAFGNL